MEKRSLTSTRKHYIWLVYENMLEEALKNRDHLEKTITKMFADKEKIFVNYKLVVFDDELYLDLMQHIEQMNTRNSRNLMLCRIAFILLPLICEPLIVRATGLYPLYKTIGYGIGLCILSYVVYKKIYLRERRDRLQIRKLVYDECKNKLH